MNNIVILVLDLFSIGGIEKYTRSLCDTLDQIPGSTRFTVISLYDDHTQCPKQWKKISLLTCEKVKIKFLRKLFFIFKTIFMVLSVQPRFVICAHINVGIVGLLLKKIFGIEYYIIAHGIDVWNIKKGLKYSSLQHAKTIICASNYSKTRLAENLVAQSKLTLLQNSVDTSYYQPKPLNSELTRKVNSAGKCVLLTVGRMSSLERYKGHDIMLEVMQKLDDSYLWLVVGDGDDAPRLKNKTKSLGLEKKVFFTGRVDDIQLLDYYNLCNIFVMPSTREGFGIVFLEALACGKPVISGNRDGSVEPLCNGELGFIINPDNSEEIRRTIQYIHAAKDKRADPEYLRQAVEKKFGRQTFEKRVHEIFFNILQ